MNKKKPSLLRSLGTALIVLLVVVVFAYGVQVTNVNFETTRSEIRLTQLKRVLRALAHPDIVEYDQVETNFEIPFYLPCPEDQEILIPEPIPGEAHLVSSTYCGSPGDIIQIEGYNLPPNSKGPINFITNSGVKKPLGNFLTDNEGYFQLDAELPIRQPVAEAQHIRATIRTRVSGPKLTRTAIATWEKIIETVFMALLATAIGTLIAVPISFLAAKNLMSANKSPLTSVALSILGWPLGILLGIQAVRLTRIPLAPIIQNPLLIIFGLILGIGIVYLIIKWIASPFNALDQNFLTKVFRILALIVIAFIAIAELIFLENLSKIVGLVLIGPLGAFGFLGNFIFQLGDTLAMLTPVIAALGTGAVIGGVLSNIGQILSDKASASVVKLVNLIFAAMAGAVLFALIGALIDWFYQFENLNMTLYWPAGIGALLGVILAIITTPKQALPTGTIIYFIVRTFLNATRSIESLVMAIIFVIWVGIGPFAGSLALALHTLAALAKLYSEQVESIMPGPLEAVQATGANKLQTIIYAVIPQITSPYISFTMYRWDINVRMSTIIGFVGGGGIGFLLQQNINLLNYRGASAQMLAIAIVVALMDYISSVIRERII